LLLGVAEAGLLPGVLLYLSRWIPARQLGFAFALLMSSTAIANVISGPVAGALMQLDGLAGLHGWQLMFLVEGICTVLVGLGVARYLPENPATAYWLTQAGRARLIATLESEQQQKLGGGLTSFRQGFLDRRVLIATLVCFLFVCCNFGTVFWLPQIIHSMRALNPLQIGWLTAIPYLLGAAATILWGRHSDLTRERRWHLVAGASLAFVGYTWAAVAPGSVAAFAALCLATLGIWSMFGVFWAYAGGLLGGNAATGGFALINSLSTLGGFAAPLLMGVIRDRTHNFSGSLLVLALFALLAALTSLLVDTGVPAAPDAASVTT
jgi:MFS transporter, ACS family, tartrate transporter